LPGTGASHSEGGSVGVIARLTLHLGVWPPCPAAAEPPLCVLSFLPCVRPYTPTTPRCLSPPPHLSLIFGLGLRREARDREGMEGRDGEKGRRGGMGGAAEIQRCNGQLCGVGSGRGLGSGRGRGLGRNRGGEGRGAEAHFCIWGWCVRRALHSARVRGRPGVTQ
jgi:hypothetical protein